MLLTFGKMLFLTRLGKKTNPMVWFMQEKWLYSRRSMISTSMLPNNNGDYFSQSQYSEQPFTMRCLKLKRKLFIALPSTVGVARLASK